MGSLFLFQHKRYQKRYQKRRETKQGITSFVDVIPCMAITCVKSGRLDLNQRPLRPENIGLVKNLGKNACFGLARYNFYRR